MKYVLLKKYFIPHPGNDHRPHFLRLLSVNTLLFLILLSFFGSSVGSHLLIASPTFAAEVFPEVLVDLTNADRASNNLNYLVVNDELVQAARLKVEDMVAKQYFAHTSPDGVEPWYWLKKAGYDFSYAGENLAIDFSDPIAVDLAWMNSEAHRANILSGNFREIGIAAAKGTYEGRSTIYIVQLFGTPLRAVAAAEPTEEPTPEPAPPVKPKKAVVSPVAIKQLPPLGVTEIKQVGTEESNKSILAENTVAVPGAEEPIVTGEKVTYSSWTERFISSPSKMLQYFYTVLGVLILFTILAMLFREFKRHHIIHITYGALLLVLMIVLLYANQTLLLKEGVIQ